jgi:hypothetical protein
MLARLIWHGLKKQAWPAFWHGLKKRGAPPFQLLGLWKIEADFA